MTGDELKTWREARGLSQAELAAHLTWTRDMVANREGNRAPCPPDLEQALEALAITLPPPRKPGAIVIVPNNVPRRRGLPSQVILNMAGKRVHPSYVTRLKEGDCYWKYDWIDPRTKHNMFNLYQLGTDHDLETRGLCRTICLDVNTWHVRHEIVWPGSQTAQMAEELDKRMTPARVHPPQTLEDCISPNKVYFGEGTKPATPQAEPASTTDATEIALAPFFQQAKPATQ